MTIDEIKAAIMAGKKVCCTDSKNVVITEQVCPLHELSLLSLVTGFKTELKTGYLEHCFIFGE